MKGRAKAMTTSALSMVFRPSILNPGSGLTRWDMNSNLGKRGMRDRREEPAGCRLFICPSHLHKKTPASHIGCLCHIPLVPSIQVRCSHFLHVPGPLNISRAHRIGSHDSEQWAHPLDAHIDFGWRSSYERYHSSS